MAEIRERVFFRGTVHTVTEVGLTKVRLRDSFGFDIGWVSKRKVERMRDDDERRAFRA